MNPEEIRGALLRVVPPLTAPPDRMAEVSRRIARTRARRAGLVALGAAVVAALAVGTPALLPAGAARVQPGGAGAVPVNVGPSPLPSGPEGSDGVGPGRCPARLDLISQPRAVVAGDTDRVVALPLRKVTLCRYRQGAFDWSVGPATRIAGPRDGTPAEFGNLVNRYLELRAPRASPPSGGCLYPSPWTDISVDVVFTLDAREVAREYRVGRISCANNPPDPARQLEAATDRVLGAPY
jgi:hypothetical protein